MAKVVRADFVECKEVEPIPLVEWAVAQAALVETEVALVAATPVVAATEATEAIVNTRQQDR